MAIASLFNVESMPFLITKLAFANAGITGWCFTPINA